MKKSDGPITKLRKWVALSLAVGTWVYQAYQILIADAGLQVADSQFISFICFSVFWFGLLAGVYFLRQAEFSRNEDGEITGDSEITW